MHTRHAPRPLALALALGLLAVPACGSKTTGVASGTSGGGPGSTSGPSGTTGGTAGATTGPMPDMGTPVTCEDEVFADTDGEPTGFEVCSNGATYRKQAVACHPRPPNPLNWTACTQQGASLYCEVDADCAGFLGGDCVNWDGGKQCGCQYDCTTDADCGPGGLCRCDPASPDVKKQAVNHCVRADGCHTDADCPEGERCLVSYLNGEYCQGTYVAQCTSPADECAGREDCSPPPGLAFNLCEYDGEQGRFVCVTEWGCGA